MTLLLPPIVAAAAVTDSLGRSWDPKQHPRGRDGKFIHTFKRISGFLNSMDTSPWMTGEVTQINEDGTIRVRVTKTVDPNLVDPSTGLSYVGNEVDIDPMSVESINEKAVLETDIFGKPVAPGAGDAFDSYSFQPDALRDFGSRAGLRDSDIDGLVNGTQAFEQGKKNQLTDRAKYHLALYAKSISGDGREKTDEDFRGLLEEIGVNPDDIDDSPDGMSGITPLANNVNDANSPNNNKLDDPQWFSEQAPVTEGAIREATLKDSNIRLGWFDDGSRGFINEDGTIEKVDASQDSLYQVAQDRKPALTLCQILVP